MELLERLRDTMLDRSILFSYDRSGFERHARRFDPQGERALEGRRCLITGANSGLGKATARALAARGAEVWLLCRSEVRGQAAREGIIAETGNHEVHLALVDLSDQSSLRRFAEGFSRDRIDVLIHNAGVLPGEAIRTDDGLELTVATNLVGPFLLSALLRERLLASDEGRLIHVTSGGMYTRRLSVDRLRALGTRGRRYDGVTAYADTKRAMVVAAELLAERLKGTAVSVHAVHPGWADTPAVRSSLPTFWRVTRGLLRSAEEGADTVIWLAAAERAALEGRSGSLWFDREPQPTHLVPWTREAAGERRELWRQLCEWTGLPVDDDWSRPLPAMRNNLNQRRM